MKLSRTNQEKAATFIQTRARPLEQARYSHSFQGGSAEDVLAALAEFQNGDGGFGNALEADLRLPESSALATSVGLQILREIQASAENALVQKAIRYLLDTFDAENQVWPITPAAGENAPHAPWWNYSEDMAQQWGGFLANPRAEIVGYLHEYAALVPADLRERLTIAVAAHLDETVDDMVMHDLMCYVRLAETTALPGDVRELLLPKLRKAFERLVARSPEQWGDYCLKPLEIIKSPDSPFTHNLDREIELNLDHELEKQQEDGSWAPVWIWGDQFPEAWPRAKLDWSGVLTLDALRLLQRFGRLE